MTTQTDARPGQETAAALPKRRVGMTEAETRCMRGDKQPHAASIPFSASRFLNSPPFVLAFNYLGGTPMQLEAMEKGIVAGRALKTPLILVEWENYLDWALDDIAADLGFERGPGDAWQVSEQLCRG